MAKSAAAFRTISEVAGELDLPQHVLRFWETKFNAVKPMKRGGHSMKTPKSTPRPPRSPPHIKPVIATVLAIGVDMVNILREILKIK